ncbi:HpaII family restriction endonuclease [Flavobacterium sp. AG291]|uniref:HpaII family restriction endonuclease n=1 Tax=Flavobacterium sp. AG291 TaxID=2184000 RepID=UPI000E0BC6AC|nr:HpaII family restriction endonuclease [Flavobacterium sp. AG291]RDI08535.1 type II restriction enzyme [Flavobacterium sp. AG291]
MLTGNKGEWSEIYVLFKLLGDSVLNIGDENENIIANAFYPIIKILRTESNGNFEYSINDEIVIISHDQEIGRLPISEFKEKAQILLKKIKSSPETTFSVPEIEEFMSTINCISLKANSSAKTDIKIIIHDSHTNQKPLLGFSIKSQLGNPSTLLNAGRTTNFIYKINLPNQEAIDLSSINSIDTKSKIKDRIDILVKYGAVFSFIATEQKIFSNNLTLIDSKLPDILGAVVFDFYTSNRSTTLNLTENIETQNPLNFDNTNNHQFYSYKIKRFLTDIALGMMPSKVWTGEYDATGGYLVVKENGDVLCYHIYNKNRFEDYLLNNTKLETASSSRHDFGKIFIENGNLFFKLNLQIRFIK